MKNFNTLYMLLSGAILSNGLIINAMDSANTSKKETYTLILAKEAQPTKDIPSEMKNLFHNSNNPPLGIIGTIKIPTALTQSKAILIVENLAKNNPTIKELAQDPHKKAALIEQMTAENIPAMVPFQYLADKKPGIIFYGGLGARNNQDAIKISETEGSQITNTFLYSQNKNDSDFVQEPQMLYVATEKFAKQANKTAREFEDKLANEESWSNRRHIGDKYGMTSGWNGGKSLMDTEKREPSSRPK